MVSGQAIVVMGVTGAGKSTVGGLLAADLHCDFLDADNFHSAENKDKMRRGVALTDEDRQPWLETLRDALIDYILRGHCVVLACSALLPKYRDLLRTADYDFLLEASTPEAVNKASEDSTATGNVDTDAHKQARERRSFNSHVVFVYLKCTAELLAPRVIARERAGGRVGRSLANLVFSTNVIGLLLMSERLGFSAFVRWLPLSLSCCKIRHYIDCEENLKRKRKIESIQIKVQPWFTKKYVALDEKKEAYKLILSNVQNFNTYLPLYVIMTSY